MQRRTWRVTVAGLLSFCVSLCTTSATAQVSCDGKVEAEGFATTYTLSPGGNNCEFDDDTQPYLGAINAVQYDGSAFCGRWVRVTGPAGTVDVRIIDQCPECPFGDLDLNAAAFAAVTGDVTGRYPVTWETVSAPEVGDAAIHIRDSSNPFFVEAQVREHRYGVTQLELLIDSAAFDLTRTTYNTFVASANEGVPVPVVSPGTFRATDVHGQVITIDGVTLTAGTTSTGSEQFPECVDATDAPPAGFATARLLDPSPNPFNPSTTISFELESPASVVVEILDARGRRVVELVGKSVAAGGHAVHWDGTDATGANVGSGVYFVRLRTDDASLSKRIVLLK